MTLVILVKGGIVSTVTCTENQVNRNFIDNIKLDYEYWIKNDTIGDAIIGTVEDTVGDVEDDAAQTVE